MKKTILLSATSLLALAPFTGFSQQHDAGTVSYQVTMQRPGGGDQGNDQNNGGNDDSGGGNVFTMNRTLTFNAHGAKLASPDFAGGMRNFGGRRGNNNGAAAQAGGDQNGTGAQAGGRGQRRGGMGNFRGRGGNNEYVDFAGKKYIRAFKRPDNDTTFYMAQDFQNAENFQASDKTKKIAGYNCHQATATWHNTSYTIWYTTDIPVTYSPVNGLVPPSGGFVLDIQSDRMEYKATSVKLQDVADADVQVPSPSQELSQDQVRDMRRQMMSRMRNRNGGAQDNQ